MAFPSDGSGQSEGWTLSRFTVPLLPSPREGPAGAAQHRRAAREFAYYLTYAPRPKARLQTLAQVAGRRWEIEIAFEAAKGECGLDHYKVRHWQGWYRHMTLAMLAHAVLAVLHAHSQKNSVRPSAAHVPELRCLLAPLLWPAKHRVEHFLDWSSW